MKHKTDTFMYKGYHFTPMKRLTNKQLELKNISIYLLSDPELDFTSYSNTYTYDEFYKSCGEKWFDLFICEENGKIYIPCENELFIYTGN